MAEQLNMGELQPQLERTVPEFDDVDEIRELYAKLGMDYDKNMRFCEHVGKLARVKTVNNREFHGWVKCLDSMSGNFFLIGMDENITKVTDIVLIMGDGCKSSEVLQEPSERVVTLLNDMDVSVAGISAALIPDRKERLFAWIKKHRLPVTVREDGTIIVCGNVTVAPPYDPENCASSNHITLRSIKTMVRKLPTSTDEKAAREIRRKEKEERKKEELDRKKKDASDCQTAGDGEAASDSEFADDSQAASDSEYEEESNEEENDENEEEHDDEEDNTEEEEDEDDDEDDEDDEEDEDDVDFEELRRDYKDYEDEYSDYEDEYSDYDGDAANYS